MRLLRRILRHSCAAFCATLRRSFKVGVRHLQVVFQGDAGRVAQPRRNNVDRVVAGQLGFPGRTHIVKQPGPGLETSPNHQPLKLSPQIAISPAAWG